MSTNKNNKVLKILTSFLAICLVVLGFFTIKFYGEERDRGDILERDKIALENNLKEYLVGYKEAISENAENRKYMEAAKLRIEALLDSVKGMKMDLATLGRFRREIEGLHKEKEALFRMVDSLNRRNSLLAGIIDSTTTVLTQQIIVKDSLYVKTRTLESKIAEGSKMNLSGLKAEALKIRNSGKIITTERSGRANHIRTCFTMTRNALIQPGEKELYIQIIDSKNNLVGTPKSKNYGSNVLNYSVMEKVFYENENLDVCVLVEEEDLEKGSYQVNVFYEAELLSTNKFELK